MKQTLPQLTLDQKVWAIIEEVMTNDDLIVSFQGDLIRVQNQSSRKFRPGQRIQLKVTGLSPLGFQLMDTRSPSATYYSKLDISV